MTRIEELEKKYPTLHKDILFKWDTQVAGIRDSKDLDRVSFWRAAPQGGFLSEDEDLTLERLRKETPWRVKDNAVLVPDQLLLKTGLNVPLFRKERSPYTIREISEGRVAVFEGEDMVDVEVYPPPSKPRPEPGLVTSKGTPVRDLVDRKHNSRFCYFIRPVRFCEYFTSGEECKFCNYNPTQEDARAIGIDRSVTINPEDTAEAFKMIGSEARLLEGVLEGGGFKRSEIEASVNLKFVEKLNSALPYKTDLKLAAEAMPRRELLRLRDAGLSAIRFQMEVFDERLFPLMLPGKAKHLSRDGWLEAYQDAVDIFGIGNVGAKFVGGMTMQGPHGFKTWQEARDSHMEGNQWMISRGVFPSMSTLRWAPGSQFSKDPTNRDKFPPTEFYLDLIVAHHAAMKEYGLYEKLNRFLYCGLDCISIYIGEAGMLEIAGDVGTWMSPVVPYKQNWIARFLDSTKSPATP